MLRISNSLLYTLIFGLILTGGLFLSGCSKTRLNHSITPNPPTSSTASDAANIVLMPLADYSSGINSDEENRRQMKILSSLSSHFNQIGMASIIQEDVNLFLDERGIQAKGKMDNFEDSAWTKDTVMLTKEIFNTSKEKEGNFNTGLTKKDIREIGRNFNAAYLLRGRIIEYEVRKGNSLIPWRVGAIPFVLDGAGSAVLGSSSSANDNFKTSGNPLRAFSSMLGGELSEAVLQLQLVLQETDTSRVVWSNRMEVEATPWSVINDPRERKLMDEAIDETVKMLVTDMAFQVFGSASSSIQTVAPIDDIAPPSYDTLPEIGYDSPMDNNMDASPGGGISDDF
jgi:hypothetical protein